MEKYFTQEQIQKLTRKDDEMIEDPSLIVKLQTPNGSCVWLVTEIVDEHTAYGLCDTGIGFVEFDYIYFREIENIRGGLSLIKQDHSFIAKYPIHVYYEAARLHGKIIEAETILQRYAV
jgi:hypothetical protein